MSLPELAFNEAGHGRPVVLLHAFPFDSGMWDEVSDGLAEQAHVVRVDLPGFGSSPLPAEGTSLADAADGVVAVLDQLGLDTAVVAGLSMGGYVTLAFAARHRDRLLGIGLLDTRASEDDDAGRARRHELARAVAGPAGTRALHGMEQGLLGEHTRLHRPDVVQAVRAMIERAEPQAVAWASTAMADRPDTHSILEGLDVPALVLVGEQDTVTPSADAERMAALLGVQPVVVPNAGHLTAVEAPDDVTSALADLVRTAR